jgi:hypothetical protein
LETDIKYINGTCETCPEFTIPNEDNTGCHPVDCGVREVYNEGRTGCVPCDDYSHPDNEGLMCITDECDSTN